MCRRKNHSGSARPRGTRPKRMPIYSPSSSAARNHGLMASVVSRGIFTMFFYTFRTQTSIEASVGPIEIQSDFDANYAVRRAGLFGPGRVSEPMDGWGQLRSGGSAEKRPFHYGPFTAPLSPLSCCSWTKNGLVFVVP